MRGSYGGMKKRGYVAEGIKAEERARRRETEGGGKNFLINTIVTGGRDPGMAVVTRAQTGSTPLNAGHRAKNGRCNKGEGRRIARVRGERSRIAGGREREGGRERGRSGPR